MMKLIVLSNGRLTQVDDFDYLIQNVHKWHYFKSKSGLEYAIRQVTIDVNKRKTLYLHREIMETPADLDCDHKDRDGLNNQRYNLRNCTNTQNMRNTRPRLNTSSKYKGVNWHMDSIWRAMITINGKRISLMCSKDEGEAARAYDRAAIKYFGEFARTNFPLEDYKNDND